jgi:biopolymer transport protein ExbD
MLLKADKPVHRRAISLTPLIDVVFILLLFFMLSSTFIQWRQVDVSAPTEASSDTKTQRILTLKSDGGLFTLDGTQYDSHNPAALKALVVQDIDAIYVIKVEPGLRTQSMINLLDALKQAGADNVSLAGVI